MSRNVLAVMASIVMLLAAFVASTASAAVATTAPVRLAVTFVYSPMPAVKEVAQTDPTRAVRMYIVRQGDYLSSIASRMCSGHTNYWTGIFQANRAVIGSNPNLIFSGQALKIVCTDPPALLSLGSSSATPAHASGKIWGVTYGYPNYYGDGDGDGYDVAGPQQHAQAAGVQAQTPARYSAAGGSSFQQCVIARESGGNSQVMNSTGHYGLYQFSESTWVAYGGSASSFGNASVAQQNQVFANAMATPGGASNWSPYDGC